MRGKFAAVVVPIVLALMAVMAVSCQQTAEIPIAEPTASVERAPESRLSETFTESAPVGAPAVAEAPVLPAAPAAEPSRVVVSYFHRTIRCETCLTFESLTERALRDGFADELASGRIVWRVMDFEEPGHESDVAKYDIFDSSVVVSKLAGDREVEWKKLEDIWGLVDYEEAFIQYIQSEVAAYLDAAPAVSGGNAAGGDR